MSNSSTSYIPAADSGKALWLINFSTKLPQYAGALNLTAAEVQSVQDDAAAFNYIMNMAELIKHHSQRVSAYKKELRHSTTGITGSVPVLPDPGPPPTPVEGGIFDRISKLAVRIKNSPGYTISMGTDLNI